MLELFGLVGWRKSSILGIDFILENPGIVLNIPHVAFFIVSGHIDLSWPVLEQLFGSLQCFWHEDELRCLIKWSLWNSRSPWCLRNWNKGFDTRFPVLLLNGLVPLSLGCSPSSSSIFPAYCWVMPWYMPNYWPSIDIRYIAWTMTSASLQVCETSGFQKRQQHDQRIPVFQTELQDHDTQLFP